MENQENIMKALERVFMTKEDFLAFKDEIIEGNSMILSSMDAVMNEVKTVRQEQIMFASWQKRQDQEINETKQRIETFETQAGIA